ncbi:hypothetical protein AOL_s00210g54 [Orbilia oligospora ATCC 24927]|uniref:Uncharacterized protein n=1 Tax=Arthrobotrys oligospora (strain ATCC 24927 / CBS 115.81 / DSM 1491) TaxID=756982 RepID=G1XRR0_ARTOA|nr:hypothetical protein AOL_s00210g54 [Orbilia oligospora ATCC 24927]EGX44182.1 hypothetical protein AOL_s00210g54 [Orbilia oligospora ATCC 24927]
MSAENSPLLAGNSEGRRASAFLPPEDAFFLTKENKSADINLTPSEPSYLPCGITQYGSETFINEYDKIPLQTRQEYVNKIIGIMSTWNSTSEQPRPLIFRLQESGDITLQESLIDVSGENAPNEKEKLLDQYDLHFWIPESCLVGINDKEKTFRREFFAVGCLIYQILKGETVWQGFLGPQAQILFEKGVYPSDMKELSHWRGILSYWSWEYVAEVNKKLKIKQGLKVAKNIAIGGIAVGGTIALTAILSPLILPVLGFGGAGVGAGSIAAGWQSAIGIVEAGSIFALCQSAGAGGAAGAAAITAVALGGTGTVVAAGAVAGASAGIENNVLRDEDLFALFLQVVRKASQDTDKDIDKESKL